MPDQNATDNAYSQIESAEQQQSNPVATALLVVSGAVLVIGLILLVLVAYVHVNEQSVKTQFLADSSLNLFILVAVLLQAYVYVRQWSAMQETLTEMRRTRQLENRAWIGVKWIQFDQVQDGVAVNAIYINSGNSPARVRVQIHAVDMQAPPPDDFEFPEIAAQGSTFAFFPHMEYPVTLMLLPRPPLVDVTNPDHAFYILGKLEYEDIFSQRHTTRFCYRAQATLPVGTTGPHRGQVRASLAISPSHNIFN